MKQDTSIKERVLNPEQSAKAASAKARVGETETVDNCAEQLDERICAALRAASDKKALDIVVLDLREIASFTERVAATDANVLVTGESGAGKDALALFIHSRSPRRDAALIKIDCAALPSELLEAELFGYERGAFTGATEARPGRLEG